MHQLERSETLPPKCRSAEISCGLRNRCFGAGAMVLGSSRVRYGMWAA